MAAEQIEKALPTLVVSRMNKDLRGGKVLLDWSQTTKRKPPLLSSAPSRATQVGLVVCVVDVVQEVPLPGSMLVVVAP